MGRPRMHRNMDLLAAVAYLLRAGFRAKEIAIELKLRPDKVSKLRTIAEREHLLESMPPVSGRAWTYDHERRAQEVVAKTSQGQLRQLLAECEKNGILKAPLSVRAFPSLHRKQSQWEERLAHFGRLCTSEVLSLMSGCTSIGLSWGATIDAIVRAIEENKPDNVKNKPDNSAVWGTTRICAGQHTVVCHGIGNAVGRRVVRF